MAISQEQLEELSADAYKLAAEGKDLLNLGTSSQNASNDPQQTQPTDEIFRYPLAMIDSRTDHLLIKVFEQIRSEDVFGLNLDGDFSDIINIPSFTDQFNTVGGQEDQLKNTIAYITLPIPQQISDSLTVSYAEDTLNPLQIAGLNLTNKGMTDGLTGVADAIGDIVNNTNLTGISDGTIKAITAALSGKAINQLGANVNPQSLITRSTGQILQSNLELLFSGVTLRSFPFSFDFTPRDPREGEMVKQIIRILKKSMAPKGGSPGDRNSLFIKSPNLFQLEYKTGNAAHPFLNRFKTCALTDLQVNYTASGTYATYGDGTPVHINVAMQFKEINPVYAEDYEDELGGVGF